MKMISDELLENLLSTMLLIKEWNKYTFILIKEITHRGKSILNKKGLIRGMKVQIIEPNNQQ